MDPRFPAGLSVFLATSALACAPISVRDARQELSAGQTGCAPENIAISEGEHYAWVATCNGRRFRCSSTGHTIACTPEQPGNEPPPRPPPPPPPPEKPIPNPEDGVTGG